jgi:hypothetical protein
MVAFEGYLSPSMSWEEQRGIYATMVEKGIRVQITLDDTFKQLERQKGEGEGGLVVHD